MYWKHSRSQDSLPMESFVERLATRASTIDELLSDEFEDLPGQKPDIETATKRLGFWCRSAASGDWRLFARRLAADGLTLDHILARFATVRRSPGKPWPEWIADGRWTLLALQKEDTHSYQARLP